MLVVVAIGAGSALAQSVQMGDTEAQVRDVLGKPKGCLVSENVTMLSYPHGIVTLVDGQVTTNTLVSAADAKQKSEQRSQAEAARKAAAQAEREKRQAAGMAELQRLQGDASFTNRPPSERLAEWERFHNKYPEVGADQELSAVRKEWSAVAAASNAMDRASLTNRIAETEAAIEKLANRSGVGHVALVEGTKELKRLRAELATMKAQQAAARGK